jgi:hypothetical protein
MMRGGGSTPPRIKIKGKIKGTADCVKTILPLSIPQLRPNFGCFQVQGVPIILLFQLCLLYGC